MSDCKCKHPCNPCNDNCPDDEITEIRDTIKTSAPLEVELLDADECSGPCGGCCSSWCKDNCWINIQSTNECLTVDTSECWVVKLTAECPKPTYVTAWDNVTIDEVTPPDECYMDWGDCWIKGWWKVNATDEKVKACDNDSTPWTLIDKLEEWHWINIDPVGCDWSYSRVKISFDDSVIPDCPKPPRIEIIDNSKLINATVSWADWHTITITDQDSWFFYAKLVLAANHVWSESTWQVWIWEEYLWQKAAVSWKPVRQSWWTIDVRNSLRRWLEFYNGSDSNPNYWWIKITKKWLYQVWFTWSVEFSYGVHAFRVQLYRIPAADFSKRNTIVESRYSWPLGYEPWQAVINNAGNIKFVKDVVDSWDPRFWEYHMDYPLIWEKTEVEWQAWIGYSASLWAVMDRVTATGNTIVELDEWDILYVWLKMSTSITHSWDMMAKIPASFLTWHIALLWADVESWDNWPEAGFSYYANLIHPFLT